MKIVDKNTINGWRYDNLGSFGRCIRGVSYSPTDLRTEKDASSVTLLRSNNIKDGYINFNDIQIVSAKKVKDDQLIKTDDVFICMSNGSKKLVGKNVQIKNVLDRYTVGAFCAIYRVFEKESVDINFIGQLFHSDKYESQIQEALQGSAINNIKNSQIENLSFLFPSINEQRKIAEILVSIDTKIEKIEKVILNTEKIKQGLMDDFFSEEIKIKNLKNSKLEDLLETIIDHRGITPKKLGGEWLESGIPAISAMNVKNGSIVKPEQIRFVNELLYKKWMPEEIKEDDVILTSEAPLGELYLVKKTERYCLSQRLFALRPNTNYISGGFLYYYLSSQIGQNKLIDRSSGSTVKGIRQKELLKIEIRYPDLTDQQKKVGALKLLDQKISVSKKVRDKLLILKKGVMSDLLSGNVRTIKN